MIDRTIQSTSYTLFDELKEGIILVDNHGVICYFNQSAERMVQKQYHLQIDQHILSIIPNSGMMRVLHTKRKEEQKMFAISDTDYLLISRYPLKDKENQIIGAVAVLQEASQKREWLDDDNIQMLLMLILQKSAEAYVIVDEQGLVIMQNPSYDGLISVVDQEQHESVIKNREEVFQTRRDAEITLNTDTLCLSIKSTPIIVDGKLKGCLQIIKNKTETVYLKKELQQTKAIIRGLEHNYQFDDFIYQSPFMKFAIEQAKLAAATKRVIFIRGEEGTGKFMLANAIHNWSENKFKLFKRIHPKRNQAQLNKFLSTNCTKYKGTIYLENVTYLSIDEQTLLLEKLREFGKGEKQASFRLIISSPIKLEKALIAGAFLEELYDELMKTNIYLPPLSERKEDIYPLSKYFLMELNQESDRWIQEIDLEAQKALESYSYTSNALELKAILQLAVVRVQEEETVLKLEHLFHSGEKKEQPIELEDTTDDVDQPLSELVEKYEKVIIEKTLRKLEGNKTLTAKTLGLSVRNLYYKLDKYHLN